MIWLTLVSLLCSILAATVLVPVVRLMARRVGMVDAPDDERKLHREPIALCGGVAVFGSLLVGFVSTILYDRSFGDFDLGYVSARWYGLVFAAFAILVVGLIDDAWVMRGRQKLLLQILIISALVGSGTVVDKIGLMGFEIYLGSLAFPVTVLWLLVAVNALNLIDGADGVATTAGCFISLGLAVLSWEHGTPLGCIFSFCLAGSLIGFLFFNKPPATIFLGDAGSMVIGLLVGVLSVWGSVKGSTLLASAPVAILAVPLFDSAAAIARRWLTGRSIYATDRAHLHHLLQKKYGHFGMLFIVAGLCTLTTVLAIASAHYAMPWLALLGMILAGTFLVVTRSFGHAECQLLMMKASHMTRSFFITPRQSSLEKNHRCLPLQGSGDWNLIWEPLVDFAQIHSLAKISIDLNLSWLHEGYHASWSDVRMPDRDKQVQVRWPIVITAGRNQNTVNIGTLHVVASATSPRIHERIADLSLRLMDLEPQIQLIIAELERQHAAPADVRVAGIVPAPRYVGIERRAEPTPLVPSRH
ncbi:undecaprenyl/decaprenyl-phosphate alpha-N-acetylglucosaminyl 1-phosphate transferase [Stieleria sp. ICT_E10.1]|uniref:MraY family glycosyltransferase n=1 Tax=Stieleria sedimenti TaxID=2976331 RepID=UPI002180597D|nr:MraY family glycosyltransferase [Stieleria sedimenti]MCS7465462.1 undecaprenyl/decaprenyl-phosphate alpha-N-acetylglucosaminyl 1-phosphate transferase [Stieleria sedimenti]